MGKDEINAFLGAGTSYEGKLNFEGSVRVDGNFVGEVASEGTLVVGQEATVEGMLKVGQLVLSGQVRGEVEARQKVVLHKSANLIGSVKTPVLVMEEGAILEGEVIMGTLAGGQSGSQSGAGIEVGAERDAA
jgi:cytoskeletal protein CcmA (bactofilin family)